jgi:nitroimidazol reductase NimA-like FMN-containing flavoprotein (pyridoxamine 5'-phosphate oxidase superfamily)
MSEDLHSSRTTVERLPARAVYDFDAIAAILDEGYVCHVGFVANGQPYVIPTGYGREGHELFLHGAAANRMLSTAKDSVPLCVTVTLVDGLVLARSAFHHSVNYRSVVLLGEAEKVQDGEKAHALEVITNHIVPDRWRHLRPVNQGELDATIVLRFPIVEGSAKVRGGPPKDDDEDYALPIWAGTLEISRRYSAVNDPKLQPGLAVPEHVRGFKRPGPAR